MTNSEPIDPSTASALNPDLADRSSATITIPVLAEQIQIDKQEVETGRLRLVKTVHESQETVNIALTQEQVDIERVLVNQYVDQLPSTRQEGDTTIYPVLKEVLVVEKRLLLVEEIRVTKRRTEVTEPQTVSLRREDISIERLPG